MMNRTYRMINCAAMQLVSIGNDTIITSLRPPGKGLISIFWPWDQHSHCLRSGQLGQVLMPVISLSQSNDDEVPSLKSVINTSFQDVDFQSMKTAFGSCHRMREAWPCSFLVIWPRHLPMGPWSIWFIWQSQACDSRTIFRSMTFLWNLFILSVSVLDVGLFCVCAALARHWAQICANSS